MFSKVLSRKRTLGVLGTVAAIAIVGAAYGYFTTSGEGTGSASVGTSSTVTLAQVGEVTGLEPGGEAQAVDFKIHNPLTTKQYIASVKVSISSITAPRADAEHPCTTADFKVTQPNAVKQDLASGDTTFSPSGATLAMVDSESNQDGCKEATVHLSFHAL